jgi:hypothetical protein
MCAAFLGIMVTSLHVAAWEYVSFAATYYLLGAIASWSLGETGLASKAPRTGAEGDTGSRAALARSSG